VEEGFPEASRVCRVTVGSYDPIFGKLPNLSLNVLALEPIVI